MILSISLVVGITMVVSFLCSLSEAALYAIPMGRVETLRSEGTRRGLRLAKLRSNIETPISAILIANTTANVVGAMIAGALMQERFDSLLIGLFSAAFTIAILLFAEVLPKTLGVVHAPRIAPILSGPIQAMVFILWPLVKAGELIARVAKPPDWKAVHTEEDILSEAKLAAQSGVILHEEVGWMKNILQLNDTTAREMMTPRSVVFAMDENMTLSEVREMVPSWKFSRVPVTSDQNLDKTIGIVLRRQVMENIVAGNLQMRIGELMRQVHFVPESTRGHQLLKEFVRRREHLFMVVDEFAGVEGLVTLEDVIERMIGHQIVDESDRHADLKELARERGDLRIRQMNVK
jgi:CBS domain containing-hemolysin-like protein